VPLPTWPSGRLSRILNMKFWDALLKVFVLFFPFCVLSSLAIIYGVFSASNLITPSVVAIVGPQISMFVSGLFYR
jgi:hypothetical protein